MDLPVETVPAEDQFIYPAPGFEGEKRLAGLCLLTVEDNTDARELIRTILASAGASVIAVASADEALAELDLGVPDVIVADIGMPGKDGCQLLREIRLRDENHGRHIPAIALTAYDSGFGYTLGAEPIPPVPTRRRETSRSQADVPLPLTFPLSHRDNLALSPPSNQVIDH